MKTFDDLEVRRPELARSYLELLKAQPGRPIALFAPRRVGKTFFLDQDMTPAARAAGFTPVYADIWLHRISPLSAINHALEEALDDATVPTSAVGKVAKTPVKKVGALSTSLEFGEEPKRRALPSEPALRLDILVARLAAARSQPVFLMLDEAQALAESAEGSTDVEATLRRMASDTNNVRGWKALLAPLSPFDRHLLVLIAQKKPPIGKNTLKELARAEGKAPTVAKVRAALERLKRVGILSGTGGDYLIEDPLLVDYLFANGPDRLL